ncbi:MobA/MobL family protein [Burkholderia gladioli]|uniref:MobA/MobL family protein n=2 Tax=Burkholderia TaxID=32008 RepID=UPI00163EC585|nr:MobA/MobL family protein [Burkholderia gladioli]
MARSTLMHVETHTRGQGHSAVSGAAYRLGVSLHDERTGLTHNYAGKGGVIASVHHVPADADESLRDVATCWNAVEAAERRKDSQVARDFRQAVPLGLTQDQAVALMHDWTTYLSDRYGTVVTSALHEDNARDAFGNEKAPGARGFHIHAYMPTRRLGPDGQFGAKLNELSNKTQSAEQIEQVRAHWADLCNTYALRAQLGETYDHRSHLRRGDGLEAETTLGVAAAAMTRRGIATDKAAQVIAQRAERFRHEQEQAKHRAEQQARADREAVNTYRLARSQVQDLTTLGQTVDRARSNRQDYQQRERVKQDEATKAKAMIAAVQQTHADAAETYRRTMPLPFGPWKRKRDECRSLMQTAGEQRDQWKQQRKDAVEATRRLEVQRKAWEAEETKAREKFEMAQRHAEDVRRRLEALTPAQRAILDREDAAQQQRVRQEQEQRQRADQQRREQQHRPPPPQPEQQPRQRQTLRL